MSFPGYLIQIDKVSKVSPKWLSIVPLQAMCYLITPKLKLSCVMLLDELSVESGVIDSWIETCSLQRPYA